MSDDLVERLQRRAEITACEAPFLNGAEDAHKTLYGEAAVALSAARGRESELLEALKALTEAAEGPVHLIDGSDALSAAASAARAAIAKAEGQ